MGAGGLLALALTIIGDIVSLKDRGQIPGLLHVGVRRLLESSAPVVGGASQGPQTSWALTGWRWVFLINLPDRPRRPRPWCSCYLHLPAKHIEAEDRLLGCAAITLAIVPLLLVAEQGRQLGLDLRSTPSSATAWAWWASPVPARRKRAGDYALIPLRLFHNVTFGLSSLLNFIIGIGMFGAIAMLPMYLQLVKGLTPTQAGLMMITFTVGILSGSITAGRTISASGTFRIFPILGTGILTAAALVMGFSLGVDTGLWVPGLIAVFFGVGLGFCMQPLTLAMQASVPPRTWAWAPPRRRSSAPWAAPWERLCSSPCSSAWQPAGSLTA